MEFKLKGDPDYNAVMFEGTSEGGNDSKIFQVVIGNVLREIRDENSVIRDASPNSVNRGITEEFGDRFSCIDDIGGRIRGKLRNQGPKGAFCKALRNENDKRLKTLLAKRTDCEECRNASQKVSPAEKLDRQVKKLDKEIDKESAARGRELVKASGKGKCVTCHSSATTQGLPDDLLFVPDESAALGDQNATAARLKARFAEGNFIETLKQRVVEKKRMPPGGLGKDLSDQDRNDILNFIQSLIDAVSIYRGPLIWHEVIG